MPTTTDFRKTITDPTPLYFAAGVLEKVRAEAPERIAKVRATDPKVVQERVQNALATLDADIKKLRDQAQTLALQGVGYAAEYAVKAKEGYDSLAEQGKSAVENWRGQEESDAADVTYEATIEREPVTATEETTQEKVEAKAAPKSAAGTSATSGTASANAKKSTTKKTTTTRKTTTPKSSS